MLTLSFIDQTYGICRLIYGTHQSLPGLLGYLILFVTQAFVPQRQFLHKGLPSPLSVPYSIKEFHLYSVSTKSLSHKTLAKMYAPSSMGVKIAV